MAMVLKSGDGEAYGSPELRRDRFMLDGERTQGRISVVEHTVAPGVLAGPLHLHTKEDEFSLVLEGRLGALLGDDVVHAEAGDLVFKPRDQWHTFWSAGDGPCRILELIAPGGFESFFDELGALTAGNGEPPAEQLGALGARYGIEFDPSSVESLCREHGLSFPG